MMAKYAAFLSYAEPDGELVGIISDFLSEILDVPTFYAASNLARGSEDWITEIVAGIGNSSVFVPILTRSSVSRPWVLYECGVADALKIPFCRVKTANVSHEKIKILCPGKDRYTHDVSTINGLVAFVAQICAHWPDTQAKSERSIERMVKDCRTTNSILRLARARSVFIAGSLSKRESPYGPPKLEGKPDLCPEEVLRAATSDISKALLSAGFMICACPDVSAVGRTIAETVENWTEEHKDTCWQDIFRIGGQLEIPAETPCSSLRTMLQQAFREARRDYLKDQECIVLLGGNQRTRIEYEVARELGTLKICPVPMFGGVGFDVCNDKGLQRSWPLTAEELVWTSQACQRIVDYIKAEA